MNLTHISSETTSAASHAPHALFVVRGRDARAYPGILNGLQELVGDGTLRGGTLLSAQPNEIAQRGNKFWPILINIAQESCSEFVVFHHFHSPGIPDPRPDIERLKSLQPRPIVALTNGDAFADGWRRPSFPPMFLQAAEAADVVLSTSMGATADFVAERTGTPTALLPNGASQPRTRRSPEGGVNPTDFDVVFIGSNNRPRNPIGKYYWISRQREKLIRQLSSRFGSAFAVFGHGWRGVEGWQGTIPYQRQQEACQRAKLVVGGVPYSRARYYTSDRPFNQILSEVPFVDLAVEGVETILRDGEHWHLASSVEDLVDRCDDLLARPGAELREFGIAAADYVLSHHSEAERCRSLIQTLSRVQQSVLEDSPPPPPDLSFLLPEVDRAAEMPLATRRWTGRA